MDFLGGESASEGYEGREEEIIFPEKERQWFKNGLT